LPEAFRGDALALAGNRMSGNRIIGIVILVVGIVLVIFGMNSSQAPLDQVSQTFTGRFTQATMMYLIIGIIAVVGGGLLALSGRRT
jgi:drug/metabolite transporter (DMT)-like permease